MIGAAIGLACVLALGLGYLVVRRRYLMVTVVGGSMRPTLRPDDRVLVVRSSAARHGIVVFRAPAHAVDAAVRPLRVKRLVAVEGEPVPEPIRLARGLPPGAAVPPDHIAVLGDHPVSEDSKHWGPIPASSIVGHLRNTGNPRRS